MQARIKRLLEELATKYNKPVYVIEEIYNSQFKLTRDMMAELEFKTIKLPNWGKYIPSKAKLEKIDYKKKAQKTNDKYGIKSNQDNSIQGNE